MKPSFAAYTIAFGLVVSTLDMPGLALKIAGFNPPSWVFSIMFFGCNIAGYALIFLGTQALRKDSEFFRSAYVTALLLIAGWVLVMIYGAGLNFLTTGRNPMLIAFPLVILITLDWFLVYVICRGVRVEASHARAEAVQWVEWFSTHMMMRHEEHAQNEEKFSVLEQQASKMWFIYLAMQAVFVPAEFYLWSYLKRWEFVWTALLVSVLHIIPAIALGYFIFRVGQLLDGVDAPKPITV